MHWIKEFIKRLLPQGALNVYYRFLAWFGAALYRHPSKQLIVVGVTGTKGKSTTSNVLWQLLAAAGHPVGLTGTINYRIGEQEWLNENKMTMLGRFQTQKLLRDMVRAGCDIAIIETTSEGIKQFRHQWIHYDVCAFTNLTPEHIDAHGGFEQYKQAKLDLFRYMESLPQKEINGKTVERVTVVNSDSEHAQDFEAVGQWKKIRVGSEAEHDITLQNIQERIDSTVMNINDTSVRIPLLGSWNAQNVGMAIGIGSALGVSEEQMRIAAAELSPVAGRMEFIDEGQVYSVIVDYAHEPVSLGLLYDFCRKTINADARIITLISSTGGGRDVARRSKNGAVATQKADVVIVTDEDPYDDDPQEIINQVAEGAIAAGAQEGTTMWRVFDRAEAMQKACALAQPGDVVIIPCKGAEQRMVRAGGKLIPWDDREVARDAIRAGV
jgi:UDP-N-acetylmuramoyl-L-alanyl-D-glutamate--2,6-diaminopimelate ligase